MIYTVGYGGLSPAQVFAAAEAFNALVVDIRFVPQSRVPGWGEHYLLAHYSERYLHLQALGNVNYKKSGEPIRLANPKDGIEAMRAVLTVQSAILLCACREVRECHRKMVGELLAERLGEKLYHLSIREVETKTISPQRGEQLDLWPIT